VPHDWQQVIRDTMPGFDPAVTPTKWMGRIAETFRSWPGSKRSYHPNVSFSAWGREAEFVTAGHGLSMSMGETSPLARIAELQGLVLLLGVGYNRCTSFHLAEYRAGPKPLHDRGAAILESGQRTWATYRDIEFDDEHFERIGAEFDATGSVRSGMIGSAESRLFSQPEAVEFARQWMIRNQPDD
jgi:aminoglycoside 3-N-acetyltransferase